MSRLCRCGAALVIVIAVADLRVAARTAGAPQLSMARGSEGDAVERGRRAFVQVGCYQCHGREAQGASTGPRLGPDPMPLAAFTRAVRTPRNNMPPYTQRILSDAAVADIYAFVAARPQPYQLPR